MVASAWYTTTPTLKPSPSLSPLPHSEVSTLFTRAESLHTSECASLSSSSSGAKGEMAFFSKVAGTGTLSDRLSALTLMVQSSPVHNTKALETLKGMAERGRGKGGREEALKAIRCVVDWWCGGGVPDRKLRYFRDQPLAHPHRTDEHLVVWFFEDWLKKYFFGILQTLETLSLDTLPYIRTQSLTLLSTLLRDKPEQEHNLLRLLVNKLGDPEKAICSRASFHILQVLQKHPGMKAIVVREIHSVIFTVPSSSSTHTPSTIDGPAQNKHIRFGDDKKREKEDKKTLRNGHVQYYSVITLNQIVLSPADKGVAAQLITIYFDIFREVLGSPSSSASTAPTRAKGDSDNEDEEEGGDVKLDSKGRILESRRRSNAKGTKGGNNAKAEKDKEIRGAAGFVEIEDANSRLVSAILTGVNRAVPFAKLGGDGIYTHIDTLFRITHTSTFNTSLQAMVLIQQIAASLAASSSSISGSSSTSTTAPSRPTKPLPKSKSASATKNGARHGKDESEQGDEQGKDNREQGPQTPAEKVIDRYFRTFYASLHDPRLFTSGKQAMYLNLLFKTAKSDPSPSSTRAQALVRRFVQVLATAGCAGGGGGSEFVCGGLFLLGELFSTVPGLRSMVHTPPPSHPSSSKHKSKPTPQDPHPPKDSQEPRYDPLTRNPLFSSPSSSPLWELVPLTRHHHPAVALHARQLLRGEPVTASADLGQGTVMGFLDRFVFKNPKKPKASSSGIAGGKGASAMQPAASALEGVKLVKGEVGRIVGGEAVNERRWGDVREERVGVDELFFYKYFTAKQDREAAKHAKVERRKAKGDDADSSDEASSRAASVPVESADEDEESDVDEAGGTKATKATKARKTKDSKDPETIEDLTDEDSAASDLDEAEIWKAMKASMPKAEGDDDLLLSDSDDLGSSDSDDELGDAFEKAMMSSDVEMDGEESDEEEGGGGEEGVEGDEEDEENWVDEDDDALSLVEGSDNEDLLAVDDIPTGLIPYDSSTISDGDEGEEEEWGGVEGGKKRKRKGDDDTKQESSRERKKRLKRLPTFASYEDYQKLIEEGPEDDI